MAQIGGHDTLSAMTSTTRLHHDLGFHGFRALLAVGSRLPLALLRPVGRAIGSASLALFPTDRRRVLEHLAIAFPELNDDRRRLMARRSARHFGTTLAEVIWLWRATPEQVADRCSASGLEHFQRARESGRGAILVTGHCGNWEILNARIGVAGLPMTIAVREIYDPRLNRFAGALRARFGTEVVERGRAAGRMLAQALMENRINGLLIDQDIRDIPGTFVPFFGRPAWTPTGAATLALKVGTPVIPAFIHRKDDNRHHMQIHPPLPIPESGSDEDRIHELTAAATAAIEAQIRAHPEQWVWMHRRWRTRPEGEDGGS